MNKSELEALVNHELITDISYVNDLINNPKLMENMDVQEMSKMEILSQPVINEVLKEQGLSILVPTPPTPPTPLMTQSDIIAAIKEGKPFKLANDVQLETCIVINKGEVCDVDLNGYTIKGGLFTESKGSFKEGNTDSYVFWNKGGKLNISGNGVVEAQNAKYSMAVWTQDGTTVINDGTYTNAGEGSDLIYASATGVVEIYGGCFEACVKQPGVDGTMNTRAAINVKDADYKKGTAKVTVCGGEFLEFDPADNVSEGPNTNFVVEGYKSTLEGNVYKVTKE